MKTVAVAAIKGGVGKSTVTAHLGLALKNQPYWHRPADIGITGSTLARALGVEPPQWKVDTAREKIIVPRLLAIGWPSKAGDGIGCWRCLTRVIRCIGTYALRYIRVNVFALEVTC